MTKPIISSLVQGHGQDLTCDKRLIQTVESPEFRLPLQENVLALFFCLKVACETRPFSLFCPFLSILTFSFV